MSFKLCGKITFSRICMIINRIDLNGLEWIDVPPRAYRGSCIWSGESWHWEPHRNVSPGQCFSSLRWRPLRVGESAQSLAWRTWKNRNKISLKPFKTKKKKIQLLYLWRKMKMQGSKLVDAWCPWILLQLPRIIAGIQRSSCFYTYYTFK